ncbi:MAG: creatininase family protein [Phycisphaerae bacterium]|nr:creatininase family protein [Phycisphaerae bacterium]
MPNTEQALSSLTVIDRLEVGPVKIQPRRVTAPYRVVKGDQHDVCDFQYSFEEDVLDAADPASLNLACMMAAQVALNYGLFCSEIVFHGVYDDADRRFLADMAENTAREIYVKKLLEPNPLLVDTAAELPAVRLDSYLRARLVFDEETTHQSESHDQREPGDWPVARSRHAVLSSGGKDSLLTYGLLRESGVETHPVFVNESGRHWFTAINAHRHFADDVPETTRVWTNSDRVFSWMLKHLPFVRPDFGRRRSDDYPIRLWTVAIFVFGALPILRKRGIGRLVIGNEYDTTRRKTTRGITHYDGLYDQSRYFDNALTRYYRQKRWNVTQFSILRHLSELLIQKILAARYPDIHPLQVSCHAAHVQDHRAYPCGQCEKCRRIVGMLTALGADPEVCGYTKRQIAQCLEYLKAKGNHQVLGDVQQLGHMLWERGSISEPRLGPVRAKERPEILQLRFDPVRSPPETIPNDLREAIYRICLEHAEGAVWRNGRMWTRFDPTTEQVMTQPYTFEVPGSTSRSRVRQAAAGHSPSDGCLLGEMTWPQAKRRLREVDIALLPVGATEQHGPHLPVDTDSFDAQYLAQRVGAACSAPRPLVLPLVPYGVSYHHEDFSGTISVGNETLSGLVYDIGMSCVRNGITKLVIINGHGGNTPALHFAAQMINRDTHIFTCVDSGDTSDADVEALAETPNDVHAGEIETSTSLATRPELVRLDEAKRSVPRFSSRYLDFSSKRSVDWYAHTKSISKTGVLGDPTKATREKGEKMWDVMIRNLVEFVEQLKGMSLDEIYQRRRY